MKRFSINQLLVVYGCCAVLASALVIAGCGGDDDGSRAQGAAQATAKPTVTTSSRSKAEYVRIANKICKKDDATRGSEIAAYLSKKEGDQATGTAAVLGAFRAVILPKIPGRIEKLRALGAPEGDEKQIERFLVSLQDLHNAPAGRLPKELRRSADLGHAYGLHRCTYLL